MDDTPHAPLGRDDDDRGLIENASADAAAGILPGSLSGIHVELDDAAGVDEDGEADGDRRG